jgi:hypothetical protein
MSVDPNTIHSYLLLVVDCLAELGEEILEKSESAAVPLSKADPVGDTEEVPTLALDED